MGQILPGGFPAQSPLPNQQIAPFTNDQLAAMGMTEGLAGPESQFLQGAQNQQAATIGGQYLDPSSNPELQAYYNAAALPMVQNYQQAVAPNILGNAVAAGGLGSSGSQQAFQNAESSLAQGLGNLGANIYEPAYQQERQLQQQSAMGAGGTAGAQYLPSEQLGGVGQQQQQQAQTVLGTGFQNLYQNAMFPYEASQMFGPMIGQAIGGSGTTIQTTPNPSQTGK